MSIIESLKQISTLDTESAGVLIGEYRGNHHIRVVGATRPGQIDRSTRFSFDRRSPHHQNSVLSAWHSSGKIQTWVGEWHTHPEDYPIPSSIDIHEWEKTLPARPMVLLIQGRKSHWLGISIRSVVTSITDYLS
ncbi:MAG: Mov34/MPN/PAD-1 family protein [Gammaproteobacteria bacterium]|nr:Mov34/MPN/PAD-1 family protein [Gammaproteobacteria bacterium]